MATIIDVTYCALINALRVSDQHGVDMEESNATVRNIIARVLEETAKSFDYDNGGFQGDEDEVEDMVLEAFKEAFPDAQVNVEFDYVED